MEDMGIDTKGHKHHKNCDELFEVVFMNKVRRTPPPKRTDARAGHCTRRRGYSRANGRGILRAPS